MFRVHPYLAACLLLVFDAQTVAMMEEQIV